MKNHAYFSIRALAAGLLAAGLLSSCGAPDSSEQTKPSGQSAPQISSSSSASQEENTSSASPMESKSGGGEQISQSSAEESTPSVEFDETKACEAIAVKKMPDKVEFLVGDEFTVAGGLIEVSYPDGTSVDVPMDHPAFTINNVSTAMAGTKTVTIKFQGKKASFKVTVRVAGLSAYFDLNYEGAPSPTKVNIVKGFPPTRPADPVREGFTFYNWYADAACTILYDFYQVASSDVTIYAQWKENGKTYFDVSFDVNYYGAKKSTYPQIVQQGQPARRVAIDPSRDDYAFQGWFMDDAMTQAFDPTAPINGNATIFAGWQKTKTGSTTYVFEAENTNLTDKQGPGYSGENAGFGMVVDDALNLGASNGKFVSYQYKRGNSLEFYIAADEAVSNVDFKVRFACEYNNMTLTPEIYQISVNDVAQDYNPISLVKPDEQEAGPFADYLVNANLSLKKGGNLIQLKTINDISMGPTLFSTAPIVDCIKLTTASVLSWDGTFGLPMGI